MIHFVLFIHLLWLTCTHSIALPFLSIFLCSLYAIFKASPRIINNLSTHNTSTFDPPMPLENAFTFVWLVRCCIMWALAPRLFYYAVQLTLYTSMHTVKSICLSATSTLWWEENLCGALQEKSEDGPCERLLGWWRLNFILPSMYVHRVYLFYGAATGVGVGRMKMDAAADEEEDDYAITVGNKTLGEGETFSISLSPTRCWERLVKRGAKAEKRRRSRLFGVQTKRKDECREEE